MAGLSSPGIGSGLDVNGIVSQLVAIERQPIAVLQTSANKLQTQLSAMGKLQSLTSALRDAATPLLSADSYAQTTATSGDATAVSATSTTKAAPGTYSIAVQSLSAGQTLVSASGQFANSAAFVGTGSLTLSIGSWAPDLSGFTPKAGSSDVVINIIAGEDSLASVRDKINAANAGVTAAIITDTSGSRLSLQSAVNGAENGFRLTAVDDDTLNNDNAGLSRLTYNPAVAPAQLTRTQTAANTAATINGIAVGSASDTLVDVVSGMTIKLAKVTTTPVTLTVTRNTESIKQLLARFASAYNDLNKYLGEQTKYDPVTKTGALFQGDSTVVGIQNQLRAMVGRSSTATPAFARLSDLGMQIQKDGTLQVVTAKVDEALKNLSGVTTALSNSDALEPANNGLIRRMSAWADGMLDAKGALPGRSKTIQSRLTVNQKDQESVARHVADTEKRLRAQYSALDSNMSKFTALSNYVSQQFSILK